MRPTYYTASQLFFEGEFRSGLYLEVQGDEIAAVTPNAAAGAKVTDFGEAAIFPGAVNTHTHSHLMLLRGLVDGLGINDWLRAVYAGQATFGPREAYLGAALSYGEALLSGTTTIADFFYLNGRGDGNAQAAIRAGTEMGIRLVMARTFLDAEWGGEATREPVDTAVGRFRELCSSVEGNPLVEVSPAPHSLYGASRPMVEAAWRLAVEYDTRWHMHVSHSEDSAGLFEGRKSIPLLEHWGVLDSRLVSVHSTYLDDEELDLLGQRSGSVSYCPASSMVFGEDILRLPPLRRRGIKVGLGTDGAASNNTQDLFAEMRLAFLCQRLQDHSPTAVTVDEMLEIGTGEAGEVLGLPVGRIKPGFKADFVVLDLTDVTLQPQQALKSHVAQAITARAIRHVYVGGRQVVRDRQLVDFDLQAAVAGANQIIERKL